MVQNPDWPLLDYAISWAATRGASPVQPYWCSVTGRTEGKVTVKRGKTYELDQVQPGEMTVTLRNDDGAFDPSNPASPYAGYVLPYRLMRLRAQYPATQNLLTADQATAWAASQGATPGFSTTTLPPQVTATGSSTVSAAYGGTLPSGRINEYMWSSAGSGASLSVTGFSVIPGQPYSFQAQIFGPPGSTAQMTVNWFNAAGSVISYAATAVLPVFPGGSVTLTATAPANAAGAVWIISGTASNSAYNLQVEQAAAPSTFTQPGTWYPLFTGYVERWPQSWSSGGNYGTSDLTVVDLFAFLSSLPLNDPFLTDVLALNPNFFYPLNEGDGASVFQDLTGKRGYAQLNVAASPWVSSGQSVESDDNSPPGTNGADVTGAFLGTSGPVVSTEQPTTTVTSYGVTYPVNGGAISIPPNPSTKLLGPPPTTWMRIIAARATSGNRTDLGMYPWMFQSTQNYPNYVNEYGFVLQAASAGVATKMAGVLVNDDYGGTSASSYMPGLPAQTTAASPYPVTDGDWHLYAIGTDGYNVYYGVDGRLTSQGLGGQQSPTNLYRTNGKMWADTVGLSVSTLPGPVASYAWVGDLAHVIELPTPLTAAQWSNLYQSWRNAWAGERSDQRYQRILNWAGLSSVPTALNAGDLAIYGPAVDIQGGENPTGVLAALQAVVDSEIGQHFITAAGSIAFQARHRRYNAAAVMTFGENATAGEVPYTNAQTDFDPTRVANNTQVTSTYANIEFTAADPVSEANYGQIGLQQTINSLDPETLTDGAGYLLYTNSQPVQRLEALPVDVGSNPAVWPLLLARELGDCVTVNRRPSNAPALQVTGFVEQIEWALSDQATCTWTAQVSSQARHLFAQLDSPTYGLLDSTAILAY